MKTFIIKAFMYILYAVCFMIFGVSLIWIHLNESGDDINEET